MQKFKHFTEYYDGKKYHMINLFGLEFKIRCFEKPVVFDKKVYQELENTRALAGLLSILIPPSSLPKAKGQLREKQIFCLNLLKDLNNICDKNNLKYWIEWGTLLGAKRHGGFIPWDSDIDVCMLREDYNKIIPLLKEFYKDTKVVVREVYSVQNFQIKLYEMGEKQYYGLDIFPIDKYSKSELTNEEFLEIEERIKIATKKLKEKCIKDPSIKKDITKVRNYIKKLTDEIILLNKPASKEKYAMFYGIDYKMCENAKNIVFNYDTIFPLSKIEFEGEKFYCPNDTEKLLVNNFGKQYMSFPQKFKEIGDKVFDYIESLKEN